MAARWLGILIVAALAACGTGSSTDDGPDQPASATTVSTTADLFQIQTATTAVAVPDTTGEPYASPAEAALAAALAQAPDLANAQVTRMIAIYADDVTVDLRVQVRGNDFCHWYGVAGFVREGALEWRGEPASPCDE